jgi:hypothetical protein
MENQITTWPEKFGLTTCPATKINGAIPAAALGVAVIYAPAAGDVAEKTFLVIESRARGLLSECERRLQTAKLPPLATLLVAFQADTLPDTSPESVHASCRRQVILAGELRRALRPALR